MDIYIYACVSTADVKLSTVITPTFSLHPDCKSYITKGIF